MDCNANISQCRLASSRDPSSFSVSPALLPPVVSSAESDSIERIGDWLQDVSTAKHMRRIANQAAAHFVAHNKSKFTQAATTPIASPCLAAQKNVQPVNGHVSMMSTRSGSEKSIFQPKKVLILTKLTRYEFEKKVHDDVSETQLEKILNRRGSNYNRLLKKHELHHQYLQKISEELSRAGIESRIVQRFDYTSEAIDWADAVFSAGGDGTFLMAASKIHNRDKPVIGINTDPEGSEGYMCLMRKDSQEHFGATLQRLLNGDFQWLFRQRIRITVTGDNGVGDSVELHDQQLNRHPSTSRWTDNLRSQSPERSQPKTSRKRVKTSPSKERITVELPVLALNEVFIGESLSSRVSYYEIQIDDEKMLKQKSSGLTICTGTGSTSWYFNINKLTDQCVYDLMKIVSDKCNVSLPVNDKSIVSDICKQFNQKLIFDPDLPQLAFCVRDPVFNATFPATRQRGHATRICVKSRGYDAHLVRNQQD
ncbi:hypothetical protein WR25_08591 isoform B [Diploscapter pachys]|uniref:NAD(+) kinase n=1 Tax=Diploscapter pachys TaxID=2018661 RepID=A0A2A2JL96_9BILA|nr:hypothetical protein WR25_08591 isoform B [Diploscapter pachys]